MATFQRTKQGGWRVLIRRKGFPTVTKTFATKAEATAFAALNESEMARGVWLDRSEADRTLLLELLDRYEREIVPKKRGQAQERSLLAAWRNSDLVRRMVSAVRGADVAAVRDEWLKLYQPATVLRRLQLLSHVFNTARREWGFESVPNPVELIAKPKVSNERDRRVSSEELDRIIAASESTYLPAILRLAVESAVRRGEIVGLRWENVRLDEGAPHLHLPETKNGQARNVPLLPGVVASMAEWRSEAVAKLEARGCATEPLRGQVFPIRADAITRAFSRARDRAREAYEAECQREGRVPDAGLLMDLHFHDVRHEATAQLANLVDGTDLAKITGHRDPRMLMRYYHPTPEELSAKIAEKLAARKARRT